MSDENDTPQATHQSPSSHVSQGRVHTRPRQRATPGHSWTIPVVTIIAAIITSSGAWIAAYNQAKTTVAAERERTLALLQAERQQMARSLAVEREQRETALILKALDAGNDDAIRARLQFLVQAGLVSSLSPA